MEPSVAVPMTLASPSFWLLILTIVGVVGIFYLAFMMIAKSGNNDAPYDPARTLINVALIMLVLVFLYVAGIVAYQVFISNNGSATTEAWGQLCLFVGWVLGVATGLYNHRFQSNKASAEKDSTIAQMARSGAVLQDALMDPNVQVTGTGDGKPLARAAIDQATTTVMPPSGAPIQTENVTVNTLNTSVDEVKPTDK